MIKLYYKTWLKAKTYFNNQNHFRYILKKNLQQNKIVNSQGIGVEV